MKAFMISSGTEYLAKSFIRTYDDIFATDINVGHKIRSIIKNGGITKYIYQSEGSELS